MGGVGRSQELPQVPSDLLFDDAKGTVLVRLSSGAGSGPFIGMPIHLNIAICINRTRGAILLAMGGIQPSGPLAMGRNDSNLIGIVTG